MKEKIEKTVGKEVKKTKSFLGEFKQFAVKGNVIDLAVGVVIGSSFTAIVNSLVNNIIMPLISLITKGLSFSEWYLALDGNKYDSYSAAVDAGAATLGYGQLITAVLNFLIVAFVIFLVVRFINKAKSIGKKNEEAAPPKTKKCPYCKTDIDIEAVRCPNCTSDLPAEKSEDAK